MRLSPSTPFTASLIRGILPMLVLGAALPALAQSPLQIKTDNSSIKFGMLLQPQFESLGSATKDGDSNNFFLRRARFLVGGSIGTDWEFFFETDSANLGKAGADGTKNGSAAPTMIVQDAVVTYKADDAFKVDVGLILIPFAHNSGQSAASLLSFDYFTYSFLQNAAMTTDVGRDLGVQFRGLVAKHLEYRLGVFQGKRNAQTAAPFPADHPNGQVQSRNSMRVGARLQYNVFDAETGMFYAGTYGGAKKILSFGVGYDSQDDYKATAFDVFFDWPLANKDVLTAQVNHVTYDGGKWLPTLPKTTGTSLEAGYRFSALKFSPILRYEKRTYDVNALNATTTNLNETRTGAGLAFWLKGHNANVKVFYMQIKPENTNNFAGVMTTQHSYNQLVAQLQYFIF